MLNLGMGSMVRSEINHSLTLEQIASLPWLENTATVVANMDWNEGGECDFFFIVVFLNRL